MQAGKLTAEQMVRALESALLDEVAELNRAKRELENAQTALAYCGEQELFVRLVDVKREAEALWDVAWARFTERSQQLDAAIQLRNEAEAEATPYATAGVR